MPLLLTIVAAALGTLPGLTKQAPNAAVQAVARGMACKQNERAAQLDCEYRVGSSLHFWIAGIGQDDVAVTFYKVDVDGDYYATVGIGRGHRCVIVKSAPKGSIPIEMAFVSPRSGKVYGDWQACDKS